MSTNLNEANLIQAEARYREMAGGDEEAFEALIGTDPRPELFWKYSKKAFRK